MVDVSSQESRLLAALRQVEREGDIGSGRADDPATMILRQVALRDDLIRWDDLTGRFQITSSGLARLRRVQTPSAVIMRLPVGPCQRRVS